MIFATMGLKPLADEIARLGATLVNNLERLHSLVVEGTQNDERGTLLQHEINDAAWAIKTAAYQLQSEADPSVESEALLASAGADVFVEFARIINNRGGEFAALHATLAKFAAARRRALVGERQGQTPSTNSPAGAAGSGIAAGQPPGTGEMSIEPSSALFGGNPPPSSQAKLEDVSARSVFDVFISHASEDKDTIARPLYAALKARGFAVWFDEAELTLGDSLRRKIDDGLARCRYGIVILSPRFLEKNWPQKELDGLVALETQRGTKALLPIWHGVDSETLLKYSPTLVDRFAGDTRKGVDSLVAQIERVLAK